MRKQGARAGRWPEWAALALVLLGGALAALLTLGPRILDVNDLGWLLHGTLGPDPVAYLVAWMYFAPDPWAWPPGRNPDYGLELSSAIFYVDVVPLMAFLAKALRPIVEIPQYWGPWVVLSATLQAGFAWKLLGLAVRDPWARAFGALLFAWQPMLLNRMGGHFALVSQWALLWALWLCLRPRARGQTAWWMACLGTVALLNAYVLAMCAGLWVADLLGRLWRERAWGAALLQVVLVPAAFLSALWLAGYFTVTGEVAPMGLHYGLAQLDLTAPFDGTSWGWLLPGLPGLRHWEHGGSYLGAGVLLLLALALWFVLRHGGAWPALRPHVVLLLVLGGMLAFALSPNLAIAGQVFPLFELPAFARRLADMLRSSERFFWPLGYALIFAAIAVLARHLARPWLRVALLCAFLVQAVDIQAGMGQFRALVAAAPPVAAERLPDPFWAEAARRFQRVRAVPAGNFGEDWEELSRWTAPRGIPSDAVYLSRVDPALVEALNTRVRAALEAGAWEPGTLYILRDDALRGQVDARRDPARDLLAEVDGITVFAPGWFHHSP